MGGPVFTGNNSTGSQLIAITSRGASCTKESPMLYTEVYAYLDWIKDASKPYYWAILSQTQSVLMDLGHFHKGFFWLLVTMISQFMQ